MARGANFYYGQDEQLGSALGATLGRALFGDPEARAKLQLQQAQMDNYAANAEESRAHAGVYGKQGEGIDIQNTAARGLPGLIAGMFPTAPAATAAPVDAAVPDAEAGPSQPYYAPQAFDPAAMQAGLPALMAALAQVQGDKVNPNNVIGGLATMMGNDEFARRGMMTMGHTPTAAFALTPERADAISARDANESEHQAVTTANIGAKTQMRGQDIRSQDTRRGQDIGSSDRRYVHDNVSANTSYSKKSGVVIANEASANTIAAALGPDTVITDNARTYEQAQGIYAQQHPGKAPPARDKGGHYPEQGSPAIDIRPKGNMSFEEAKRRVAQQAIANGGYLHYAENEGTHWHFDVRGVKPADKGKGGGSAGGKAQKQVSGASLKMLDAEFKTQLDASGYNLTPGAKNNMRTSAVKLFQQSGNPVDAVNQVFTALKRNIDGQKGGAKPAPKAAAAKPAGKPGVDAERKKALAAIGRGADAAKIRELYKQRTGQAL